MQRSVYLPLGIYGKMEKRGTTVKEERDKEKRGKGGEIEKYKRREKG